MLANYNGLSNSSGIYVIFNSSNWRLYIGSCKLFKKRWYDHKYLLINNKHFNKFLQADFNKCGEDVFEFHILEDMPDSLKEERLEREQHWLDIHFDKGKRCYNLSEKVRGSKEGYKMPYKVKRKPHTNEAKEKMSRSQLGKQASEESKLKVSISLKTFLATEQGRLSVEERASKRRGIKRPPFSEEWKNKISTTLKGNVPWNKGKKTFQIPWNKKTLPMEEIMLAYQMGIKVVDLAKKYGCAKVTIYEVLKKYR